MASIINYTPICKDVEKLIKNRLKDLGLVKTGALSDSIKVTYSGSAFKVSALDYFEFLDDKHDITYFVFSSNEFVDLMENLMQKEIEDKIKI